ncbi:hypothetical protein RB195_023874 [Necator americanus]|uniref:Reverse transcriptase domain-containing protein n=1 Tax=Necator americanus TaxID=51031 RepID=A0ABR1EKX1_NECAM
MTKFTYNAHTLASKAAVEDRGTCDNTTVCKLIRQRGATPAAGNRELRHSSRSFAEKRYFDERRASILAEAEEAGKNIRYARHNFANPKIKVTALPDGTNTASRRRIQKVIHDFYSDLLDSHVRLPPHHVMDGGYVIPEVIRSEVRHHVARVQDAGLTTIDLKKAYDSVGTEAVMEALENQGVPTPNKKILYNIVLITSSTNQPEPMLTEFHETCNMWMQSSAERRQDDIHEERMGF